MDPQEDQGHALPSVKSNGNSDDKNNNTPSQTDASQLGSLQQQAQPVPVPPAVQSAVGDSGLQAEDVDLIEKEWVEKAKNIVDQTQGDPFTQSEELSKMKSEYLKKRYDREINTGE